MFLIVLMICVICFQEEEFTDTFFGPSDYELHIKEKILSSAKRLNSIDIFDAEENPLEVPSNTDPFERTLAEL